MNDQEPDADDPEEVKLEDVCDQLDETDELAEVKIFADDIIEEQREKENEDEFEVINEVLIEDDFIIEEAGDGGEAAVYEIPESSQLAQTLLETGQELLKEELAVEKTEEGGVPVDSKIEK